MSMIKCPECGHSVSDKAKTCPNCGVRIKKRSYAWLIYLTIILILIAGACGYFYYADMKAQHSQNRYENVIKNGNVEELEEFLLVNDKLTDFQTRQIQQRINVLKTVNEEWSNAVERSSRSALETFIRRHPDDTRVEQAKLIIDSLDWVTAKHQNTESGYQAYLDHHENGQYYYEALNAKDRLAEARREAELRMNELSDSLDAIESLFLNE